METIPNKCLNLRLFTLTFSRLIYTWVYIIAAGVTARSIRFCQVGAFKRKEKNIRKHLTTLNAVWHGIAWVMRLAWLLFAFICVWHLAGVRFHRETAKCGTTATKKKIEKNRATTADDNGEWRCMHEVTNTASASPKKQKNVQLFDSDHLLLTT